MERLDIGAKYGESRHGFSFGISAFLKYGKNIVDIAIDASEPFKFQSLPFSLDTRDRKDLVEVGTEGWLFLKNDSNDISGILSGKKSFRSEDLDPLRKMFIRRHVFLSSLNVKSLTFVIPDKSVVCWKKRMEPMIPSTNRPAVTLRDRLDRYNPRCFEYGLSAFDGLDQGDLGFFRTDVHPSSSGRIALFKKIAELLEVDVNLSWSNDGPMEFSGDLGDKLDPQESELTVLSKPVFETVRLLDEVTPAFSKGLHLTGKRMVHESSAVNGSTCVLIGTSTAYHVAQEFFATFKHVHFYWGNDVDDDFVRLIRPDYVVCLIAERFLSPRIVDNQVSIPSGW
ncbi:hypothetical protein FIU28_16820 [Tardiphaga sp. vice154]|uniref:hypothetical protein n=1 Tax=Tardiphaga sp. vice154 TaxID=2592814 RepID=UPI0011647E72|nr:hypothetical protein [Tardiphaga sp. vice154]QDM22630.1 hypothetical protein FIU28_16820 [Tardiphaga sp. vice154]